LPALAKEVTLSILQAEDAELQESIKQDAAQAAAAHVSNDIYEHTSTLVYCIASQRLRALHQKDSNNVEQ
jgi:hypothetical protein